MSQFRREQNLEEGQSVYEKTKLSFESRDPADRAKADAERIAPSGWFSTSTKASESDVSDV